MIVLFPEIAIVVLDEVQDMEMKLKRRKERMMSRCLTWFPISGLGEPHLYHDLGVDYKNVGRLWRVSDCEELVEVTHRR